MAWPCGRGPLLADNPHTRTCVAVFTPSDSMQPTTIFSQLIRRDRHCKPSPSGFLPHHLHHGTLRLPLSRLGHVFRTLLMELPSHHEPRLEHGCSTNGRSYPAYPISECTFTRYSLHLPLSLSLSQALFPIHFVATDYTAWLGSSGVSLLPTVSGLVLVARVRASSSRNRIDDILISYWKDIAALLCVCAEHERHFLPVLSQTPRLRHLIEYLQPTTALPPLRSILDQIPSATDPSSP